MQTRRPIVVLLALALVLGGAFTGFAEGKQEAQRIAEEGAKHFDGEDIDLVFFPGGSEGGPFATRVYRGARHAEYDLGVNVEYVWSEWLPNQMVNQFRNAIGRNPDGIAIMGHPGVDALRPLVERARNNGIIVTSQNVPLPELEQQYKANGFGYVGQELYPSGETLARGAVERSGLGEGDKAMVWGLLGQEARGQRTRGAIDALEEAGLEVDYIEISDAVNSDASQGTSVISSYIASNPDVDMIIADHGALTATFRTYLQAANQGPDDIYAAGFDLTGPTATAIENGWVDLVLDQQPYLQGYLPIVQLAFAEAYNMSGLHINTGAALVDSSNIDAIAPLVEEGIR